MKKIKYAFVTLIVLIILSIIALLTYTFIEPKTYDFMMKHVVTEQLPFDNNKNVYGHDDIVLVIIDDKSIEKYRWPWKRDLHNKVLKYFQEYAKPKVLVYDSIFATLDYENNQSDKKYFNTIKHFDNLVQGIMFNTADYDNIKKGADYDNIFVNKFAVKNIEVNTYLPYLYKSMLMSPNEFIDSAHNIGSITIVPGFLDGYLSIYFGDEVYRTQEYLTNYKGAIIPSLAMKSFLVGNNNPKIVIDNKYIQIPDLGYKIQYLQTPFQSIVPVKFYKQHKQKGYSHIKYSAVDIMDSYDNIKAGKKPIINPDLFKDKYVIFGANVSVGNGLNDIKNTPLGVGYSGADFQATSLDNLVHNDFMKLLPNWLNFLITLICMLLVYYTIRSHTLIKAINYTFIIIFLIFIFACISFYYAIIVNIATPIVMSIITMILAYIHQYVIEAKTKEKVEDAMGKFMSEDVMKNVIKNIDNLGLGGKKAIVTVLFSDIRGFTSMSEKMSAQEVSELLNEYFSEMEPIVTKHNGIINKFIGDAVMAVFGEPIQDEQHPINAVKCGYEMLKKVENLNEKWSKEGKPTIQIGVGINTGEVFVGNIGSEKRMEYTVIGDTVNLASRLESYNKTYKTHILISSTTYEATKNSIDVNKISDVEIRGKAEKMDIYEVKNLI